MCETHYIRAGWLIDGSGSAIQRDVLMTVVAGSIADIKPFSTADIPKASSLTDLSFATILPPLIDCHVHLAMSGSMNPQIREHQLVAGCDELEPVIAQHLELLFGHGVLAVRDGGDRDGCVSRYLQKLGKDSVPVRVMTPGSGWYRKGRYGKLIGKYPAENQSLAEAYGLENASGEYVKVVNSGLNSLTEFGRETATQFDAAEIRQLVKAARRQGKRVMVHANGRLPVQEAIEAGCHSIEHGFFMGRENLARMAEHECVWVPTACTMKAYAEILEHDRNSAGAEIARKNLQHQMEQLRLARELGVTVALGTDAGSPGVLHGESVFEEMKLLAKAGYSLAETVQSATSIGAKLLGFNDIGLLAKGRSADFLVARGTPGQLPRKLSYLEGIYVGGKPSSLYRKNPYKHVQKSA